MNSRQRRSPRMDVMDSRSEQAYTQMEAALRRDVEREARLERLSEAFRNMTVERITDADGNLVMTKYSYEPTPEQQTDGSTGQFLLEDENG